MRVVRITASFALAAYLTLVFASGRGAVLCAGADGHVALEVAFGGASCSPSGSPKDGSDSSASDTHCGTCVDTPILTEAHGVRPVQQDRTLTVSPVFVLTFAVAPVVPPQWVGDCLDQFAAASDIPASLRTTVLLI